MPSKAPTSTTPSTIPSIAGFNILISHGRQFKRQFCISSCLWNHLQIPEVSCSHHAYIYSLFCSFAIVPGYFSDNNKLESHTIVIKVNTFHCYRIPPTTFTVINQYYSTHSPPFSPASTIVSRHSTAESTFSGVMWAASRSRNSSVSATWMEQRGYGSMDDETGKHFVEKKTGEDCSSEKNWNIGYKRNIERTRVGDHSKFVSYSVQTSFYLTFWYA